MDQVWIGYLAPAFSAPGFAEMTILEAALADGRAGYFSNRVFTGKQDDITVQSYYQSDPEWDTSCCRPAPPARVPR